MTVTPDWDVGMVWVPPGMEIWKSDPCATDVGELAAAVKASWANPVGPANVKYVVVCVGVGAADADDNVAAARPDAAASAAAPAATRRRVFPLRFRVGLSASRRWCER
ncbi:MAG: hypothetical protein ACYCU7_07970 [Acidimicrobiales bacterium]